MTVGAEEPGGPWYYSSPEAAAITPMFEAAMVGLRQ
jgi:hypothetical protein